MLSTIATKLSYNYGWWERQVDQGTSFAVRTVGQRMPGQVGIYACQDYHTQAKLITLCVGTLALFHLIQHAPNTPNAPIKPIIQGITLLVPLPVLKNYTVSHLKLCKDELSRKDLLFIGGFFPLVALVTHLVISSLQDQHSNAFFTEVSIPLLTVGTFCGMVLVSSTIAHENKKVSNRLEQQEREIFSLEGEIESLKGAIALLENFFINNPELLSLVKEHLQTFSEYIAKAPPLPEAPHDPSDRINYLAYIKKTKSICQFKLNEEICFIKSHPELYQKFHDLVKKERPDFLKKLE